MSIDNYWIYISISSSTGFLVGLCIFKLSGKKIIFWHLICSFILGVIISFLTTFFYPLIYPILLFFRFVSFDKWMHDIVPFYLFKDVSSVLFMTMLCVFYSFFGGVTALLTFIASVFARFLLRKKI